MAKRTLPLDTYTAELKRGHLVVFKDGKPSMDRGGARQIKREIQNPPGSKPLHRRLLFLDSYPLQLSEGEEPGCPQIRSRSLQ